MTKSSSPSSGSPLMVRLDSQSKEVLAEAAQLRHISVSDYVRTVVVPQAQKEVDAAQSRVLVLSPQEQLEFWNALNAPVRLTAKQKKLAAMMRKKA